MNTPVAADEDDPGASGVGNLVAGRQRLLPVALLFNDLLVETAEHLQVSLPSVQFVRRELEVALGQVVVGPVPLVIEGLVGLRGDGAPAPLHEAVVVAAVVVIHDDLALLLE